MNLSLRRSQQYRDEIKNPRRENDFLFQQLFDASQKSGWSSDPGQFWLDHLLYLLETSHEDILAEALRLLIILLQTRTNTSLRVMPFKFGRLLMATSSSSTTDGLTMKATHNLT
jgi:hypothetical protein